MSSEARATRTPPSQVDFAPVPPAEWREATLGELFTLNTPGHWGDDPDGDGNVMVLRSTNFRKSGGLAYETAAPRQFDDRKLIQKRLQPGDIILERSGGSPAQPVGRARRFDAEGCFSASNFMQIMRAADQVDNWFASYLLEFIYDQGLTEPLQKATTGIRNLDFKTYLDLPVSTPPPDEQRRITKVLRSVDDAIAATETLLKGVKTTKQGAMETVLSGAFDEVRLESLLADTRYPMRSGPFGSALLKAELQSEGIPFLGIDNVHVERFVPVYRRFVSDDKYRELARYTVYPGDVMITIMGTVGRCCVVPHGVGTAISSKHVWTLTLDQTRYSPALLAWQVNHSPAVLAQMQGSAQGGIMSAISSGTLRDLLVPLPSPDKVEEIEGLLLSFNAEIADLEAELKRYRTTKTALMSDLLSGRVRVPA